MKIDWPLIKFNIKIEVKFWLEIILLCVGGLSLITIAFGVLAPISFWISKQTERILGL